MNSADYSKKYGDLLYGFVPLLFELIDKKIIWLRCNTHKISIHRLIDLFSTKMLPYYISSLIWDNFQFFEKKNPYHVQ